jgi:hypothetical protein
MTNKIKRKEKQKPAKTKKNQGRKSEERREKRWRTLHKHDSLRPMSNPEKNVPVVQYLHKAHL